MRHLLPLVCLLLCATDVDAQTTGSLRVIVIDQTGAAIVNAAVRVTPSGGTAVAMASNDRGQAVLTDVPAGDTQIHIEAPGFAPYDAQVKLRRGSTNHTATLRIAALQEELVVTDGDANGRRDTSAFTTTLNEEDLANLPDDPDEFEEALRQMAGGDAVFQVNGFRGGRLPPKNQIRQIRFRTNAYGAENHEAGHAFVEIQTKPGMTAWSGGANMGFRSDVLNARNAFSGTQTPEQFRRFSGNLIGPLKKERTSVTLNVDGNLSYDSQTIVALTPTGPFTGLARRPVDRAEVTFGVEHAFTSKQTMRFEYQHRDDRRDNLGVGDFSLPDRAFTRDTGLHQVRGSLNSILGKSAFNELRVEFKAEDTSQRSRSSDPAVVVIDAFTRGGAGIASDRTLTALDLTNNTDFTIGKHVFRGGVRLEAGAYRQLDARNANGTFTFGSLESFNAGTPATYTQRVGEVETSFSQMQAAAYIQDDFRVNKNLSLSVGVREEFQNHVSDRLNFMPRGGFSWNPFGSKTAVRGGYGLFHDWLTSDLYDQTLRVNGVDQRDLLILNPGYPDPFAGTSAVVLPGGRVQLSELDLPVVQQFSIGVERPIGQSMTLQATYMRQDGWSQLRSINRNAPDASGIRPEPGVGTVAEISSSGKLESNRLFVMGNYRIPQSRTMLAVNYILSDTRTNYDTALSLPADSHDPDAEWGPSAQDVRHRIFTMFNFPLPKGMRGGIINQAQSGSPYTIITGRDDNGDGVTNDRPAGIGRNSARGDWRWDLNARVSRGFGFGGERRGGGGATIQRRAGDADGGGPMMMMMEQSNNRFRVDFYVQGYNLLNRVNYVNFSGNLLSPFFGRPTSSTAARRVEVGFQFAF